MSVLETHKHRQKKSKMFFICLMITRRHFLPFFARAGAAAGAMFCGITWNDRAHFLSPSAISLSNLPASSSAVSVYSWPSATTSVVNTTRSTPSTRFEYSAV